MGEGRMQDHTARPDATKLKVNKLGNKGPKGSRGTTNE